MTSIECRSPFCRLIPQISLCRAFAKIDDRLSRKWLAVESVRSDKDMVQDVPNAVARNVLELFISSALMLLAGKGHYIVTSLHAY